MAANTTLVKRIIGVNPLLVILLCRIGSSLSYLGGCIV